ncbi:membrane protein [Streptomyces sp. WM6372]|nr:membrane protein [Streptomyces sp. WM6372]
MNSAPHLLTEDRPEFDRLLDEALRTAHERPELAALGERLNAEQLRTMAIGASALLTAAAAAEYDHYVKIRGERRDEVLSTPGSAGDQGAGQQGEGEDGAGVSAVVAVLAPVLAGTAMLIFLLVGYILKAVEPEPAFAETMLTAGWLFGALTVVSLLFAVIGLLVTAVRNRATEVVAEDPADAIPDEVARAREAWRHALLERGILPFLRDALADPSAAPAGPAYPSPHTPKAGRIPNLGYTRPDFTSPGSPSQGPRPGYTPPDFTSPDFSSPDGGTQ